MSLTKATYSMINGAVGNVLDYGADSTGVNDSTAAFISALAANSVVEAPSGIYRLDTMVSMNTNKTLIIRNGAHLKRYVGAASNDPIIWFNGRDSSVIGEGSDSRIIMERTSYTYGIVRYGAPDMSTAQTTDSSYNLLLNLKVSGATPQGSSISTDKVVTMYAPGLGGYVCFFNKVIDCILENGSAAIELVGDANGGQFSNLHFYRAGYNDVSGAVNLRGCLENQFVNCFHHSSPGGASMIVDAYGGQSALFNTVLNFVCEQGGSSYSLRHINGSYGMYQIVSNTALGPQITPGTYNTFIINGDVVGYALTSQNAIVAGGRISTTDQLQIGSTTGDLAKGFFYQSSATLTNAVLNLQHVGATSTNSAQQIKFLNSIGTIVGTVTSDGTTTAFNTSSDARLKTDKGVCQSTDVISKTVIHDFEWLNGTVDRGVFAQEAVLVKPSAVVKGSDETDIDGNLMNPWGVDYSKYVPDLIVELQALRKEFEEYKTTHP
jgi:hypothetical protein